MTPQESLQKFIARHLVLVQDGGGVTKFELYHASADTPERLQLFPVITGESLSEELAQEIYDVAMQDRNVRASSTPERYGCAAFVDGDEQPIGTMAFVLEGVKSLATMTTFDDTEPANFKGLVGQQMRHNETMMKTMLAMTEVVTGRVVSENQALRARVNTYELREDETRAAKEAALDMKQEREIAGATSLQRAKRMDQIGGMLVSVAPMMLSAIFGKKGAAGAQSSAMLEGAKAFLSELDASELEGILTALKPAHQMTVLSMYKTFQESVKKDDETKPAILRACESAA